MLINDGRILKNSSTMFKAQVVNSYVQLNSPNFNQLYFTLSGATSSNPFYIYYKTPSGTTKYTYTYDGYLTLYIPATNESSYKDFYFSGNLNALTTLEFSNQYYYSGALYHGDLINLMNQFPNLNLFKMNFNGNNYYDYSIFNQDITNTEFPVNINTFHIADSTLSGNINTITNFNKVSDLELVKTSFTGNLGSGFTNLSKLILDYLPYLNGSLNNIFANSPNINYLSLNASPNISANASTLDVSKLNYMYLYMISMPNIIGNVSGWTFSTGLTTFDLYNSPYMNGNISNWDFSGTKLSEFLLYGNQGYLQSTLQFYGNLSGWTLPNTINNFQIYFCMGITSIPTNYSGYTNLMYMTMYALNNLDQNINDFKFNKNLNQIAFINYYGRSKLHGSISTFVLPLSATTLTINYANLTGDITQLILPPKMQYLDLSSNFLTGDVINMTIPVSLLSLNIGSNSGVTFTLSSTPYYSGKTAGVFHTNNMNQIDVGYISGITGNLSNLIIDNQISNMYLYSNYNFYCDLSKLNIDKVYYFNATGCVNLHGDLSNWLTGSSTHYEITISNCFLLSGDTSGWNVNNVDLMRIDGTNLSGQLKMTNPYNLHANNTKISSNIATDFNFANRAYQIELYYCPYLTGNLSGVTLCNSQNTFYIYGCTGITGSNSFINYLFIHRKNFTYYYLDIAMSGLGDSVTGGTKQLGDTGTFPVGTGGTGQWNLTEAQVDYLVAGLDYTGTGSSISWTQGEKVYWMENAKISSTNLNNRYISYSIAY
jgi:hypothetical protein